jgi:hypothetical protein
MSSQSDACAARAGVLARTERKVDTTPASTDLPWSLLRVIPNTAPTFLIRWRMLVINRNSSKIFVELLNPGASGQTVTLKAVSDFHLIYPVPGQFQIL